MDSPSDFSSVERDIRVLRDIIMRLNVRSLSDAGLNVCEMFHEAIADASELNARLIMELEFRQSIGAKLCNRDVSRPGVYRVTNPDIQQEQLAQVIPFKSKHVQREETL